MTRMIATIAAALLLAGGSSADAAKGGANGQPVFNQPNDVKQAPAAIRQACRAYWDAVHDRGTAEFVQCVRARLRK